MKQVSRLELRPSFLDVTVNRGSGLVVGLVPRSIYRIIHIQVSDLPSGEGRVTIGVGK